MFKALDNVFDYTVDDWQTMGTYAFFSMILGTLLAIGLYLIVYGI